MPAEEGPVRMPPDWLQPRHLDLLKLMARRLQLDRRFRRRFDSSDLVGETLLRAQQAIRQFRGGTEPELLAWLQQILHNVACDEIRKGKAKQRDLDLERSLDAAVTESSAKLGAWLADLQPSPSKQLQQKELLLQVAEALNRLPDDQRDVILLHHTLGATVNEIAAQFDRTAKAVALLLYRGLKTLRTLLSDSP
jgi:RNA polymerase sigma-70 factor (ECF subfamily)